MASNEFSPYQYFNRVIGLWWLIVLVTILGGVLGFIFYHLHPPIYEATATFFVTLDLNRFPLQGVREDLIQYNEDLAVNTTQDALLSTQVRDELIAQMKTLGIPLTANDILQNGTVERKHEIWELRYRSQDPLDAQLIVNSWAKIGYQVMLAWQKTGKAPNYVIFQAPTDALLPTVPVLYGRNNLMLAGALIGFIVGIVISTSLNPTSKRSL
jgi:uncharacterized protein involved in exopolysaccharide biosynthesis